MSDTTHNYDTGEYSRWQTIDKGMSAQVDAGDPTVVSHALMAHGREASGGNRFQLAYAAVHNRSGAAAFCGIGARIPSTLWLAGQWTDATTTYTDDTTDAQDTGGTDVPLETTTNNDGFIVLSRVPFNCVSLNVVTASIGAGVVRSAHYVSPGGTWKALPNLTTTLPQTAGQNYVVGENVLLFLPPADWAITTGGEGTSIPVGYYAIRVRATTAPTTAGVAHTMTVHRIYWMTEGIADNAVFEVPLGGMYAPLELNGDYLTAVVACAAGTTTTMGSRVTALARCRG